MLSLFLSRAKRKAKQKQDKNAWSTVLRMQVSLIDVWGENKRVKERDRERERGICLRESKTEASLWVVLNRTTTALCEKWNIILYFEIMNSNIFCFFEFLCMR